MGDKTQSYLSEIDWTEKIISQGIEQNSKKWLLNDVAQFLNEEYGVSDINNKHISKAVELMDGSPPGNSDVEKDPPIVVDKSERERKLVFKQIVRDAQEKGYLENFQLAEPWHPKLFMEGELNTYPYQHNTMITFRGVSRDHFYLGGDDPTGKGSNASKRHSDSVLNLGHWNPGNSWNSDNEDAVWTTFKDTAEGYASRRTDGKRGVLLEMQLPTKWVQCGAHGVREVNNLMEIQNEFGSPQAYREHIRGHSDERCAWLIRPKVPLHFIRKIWDLEIFNTSKPGYALPLQSEDSIDGIDLMHFFQKKKLPDEPNFGNAEKHRESRQIVAMKRVISDTIKLKEFCEQILNELRWIEGKEYNMKLIRKVVSDEENINRLISDLVDSSQELGISTNLKTAEADNIEEIEKEIENIHEVAEKIEQNSEKDISSLISKGEVSKNLRKLINELYEIQVGDPDKAKKAEILESRNQDLREVTNNVVKNFRKLKIGDNRDRYSGYKNIPLHNFDGVTRKISEDVGGPSEGLNQAVRELKNSAEEIGLNIQIEEKEVRGLDSLQKALGRILRITKIIDNRIGEGIEDIVSEGKTPDSLIKPLENIFLIKISDDFEENVNDSKEKISNELGLLKREINDGIEIVNWFYQLEVRLAEVVKMTDQALERGELKRQELYDIGNALFSYEKQYDKRYGIKEIIKRARRRLDISKDVQEPRAENLKKLNKAAKERLKFVEQEKADIEEVENKLKDMKDEVEEVRESYHDIPKERLQNQLEEMQKEFEKIMSEDGELNYFFSNIKNVSWEYLKYKHKVKN
ncbi:hypothetical protein GLT81_00390 [Nanohaloarchaea archaeon]|nr:hypothetical protein [Candidatus Nanohaloarchaea archaeon]